MADLSDIITSKVRIKVLRLFFANPTEMYHVRGVVREVGEEINAVRRELERLEKAGILKKEARGNRIYYWVRIDYSMFGDLVSMVAKSTGLGFQILSNKSKLGKIAFAMFSGRFVRYKKRKRDEDVDILIVGEVTMPELAAVIRAEEARRNVEINYTVMSKEEFEFRKKRRDPFVQSILLGSRVMLIGDEEDLVS
ncbi:hypothetical protein A3D84_02950 [Candidatus Woesebacteria bacterium RIFCSPHIGHO2_02_FULL_42_20]|uniref:HTH arsR-type domain-containing protein n=1 Tax=Candidatus Woesebacteria bacterium RIFCSPHIGHO2_12_FULL_41_24 TaxID=1802510 RepID=A0A1F8AS07_9BACT|nr:MAG: hypothetical protein A2W15_03140 [Candidatus Woesebacteria bacterium RBG_16_41_13]OGM29093.1 MAG: hypothetical protein A2873_01985 [Candidatus Woesebacteria bacterium RIFCSPHIGHO2_01_FULL_42_80]OGM34801.1 MAG: hypothetical protein A3D84_02950 [Candidatus Woesebacteria bacterium RIFCSPHIGHO2_02_FULL_42_20]OGM54546.1 MAG: hypothetical protein A3E44_06050 [Candidatus Woesebacteria bacterium RIFCSPHIGHO2_12_FULL_41_24]OGM66747.1 MAG: hypothetical protein A2969_05275 [Candidatus Woesebacteri